MSEVIQFSCPSCETILRLPLDRAGWQGPCPRCSREIIAPDPSLGLGATLVTEMDLAPPPTAAPPESDTEVPRLRVPASHPHRPLETVRTEPLHAAPRPVLREPAPLPTPATAPGPRGADSRRPVLVLSILLSSVISLVAGYLMGVRSDWIVARTPFPQYPSIPSVNAAAVKPPPAPVRVDPPVTSPPAPVPVPAVADPPVPDHPAEPVKASAAAESTLRAFLEAPDWSSRGSYVLSPERVRPIMESYARETPDGPTGVKSISVESSYTDSETGNTCFIFKLVTDRFSAGFPVAVAETGTGWLVDWESFVEFRDDRFRLFAEGPADRTARFHLLVRKPTPEQAAGTENEHFTSLLVEPPLPDRQRLAYVKKGTEAFHKLNNSVSGDMICAPVLELAKRTTPDGKSYLEITRILADDWLPDLR